MMQNKNNKDKSGGMYRGVNVPVKVLDIAIISGIVLIAVVTIISAII